MSKLKYAYIALFIAFLPWLAFQKVNAQDYYGPQAASEWLTVAEAFKPKLIGQEIHPVGVVKLIPDTSAFQGWKTGPAGTLEDFYSKSFRTQSGTVIDFGAHLTGYYTFTIKESQRVLDGPLRFKLTFAEVPAELSTPFDPYPGTLSRAWLQDETITVMELPATITLPRRMSFRYLKIDLLASPRDFDFKITEMKFSAVSSVNVTPPLLSSKTSAVISKIDAVGLNTLKECMQTIYEDGPKRDRRLWIGDLYLQAMANNYSFKNHDLTKRCLYMIAGLADDKGFLYPNAFETPAPHPQQGAFLFEYSLFFNTTLKEYLAATGDKKTATDLWPVAKQQLENINKHLDQKGLFNAAEAQKEWWLFVDWREGLDKQASLQGIMIFALKETWLLAKELGKEKEVSHIPALISKMTAAARVNLYDKQKGVYVSGPEKQVSYASQAWMVISGVATKAEGQKALKSLVNNKNAVRPGTPYLYHYYVAALIKSGLTQEAKAALEKYWGGMVQKGADTFWEAYDPDNELLSPYNFFPVNSYCHAWSCTPVYFIRKYPEIFQQ
ncbi:glycoside hydrolase [Pedobacter psychroterrae]|uniref:Glycoside hydrolase n=2 Tax=Pedobacter psychroterrae TaxID=2530453 RepID=A0A4R0NY11_9SPHI|nr:glycoside hydrolase [Pedobacter psychroterrae]